MFPMYIKWTGHFERVPSDLWSWKAKLWAYVSRSHTLRRRVQNEGSGPPTSKGKSGLSWVRKYSEEWRAGKTITSRRGFPRAYAGYLGGSQSPVATSLCSSEGARFGPTVQGKWFGWWVFPPGENNPCKVRGYNRASAQFVGFPQVRRLS